MNKKNIIIVLIILFLAAAAVIAWFLVNSISDYRYNVDHQQTCEEACSNRNYEQGVCMGEGSATGADLKCENTGGLDIGGKYKGCDRFFIGSWDVCCCK